MASLNTVKYTCNCGNTVEVTRPSSANFMDDAVVKTMISGEIMIIQCPKCGAKSFVDRVILYSDILHKTFVFYVPNGSTEYIQTINEIPPQIVTKVYRDYEEFAREVSNLAGGN